MLITRCQKNLHLLLPAYHPATDWALMLELSSVSEQVCRPCIPTWHLPGSGGIYLGGVGSD